MTPGVPRSTRAVNPSFGYCREPTSWGVGRVQSESERKLNNQDPAHLPPLKRIAQLRTLDFPSCAPSDVISAVSYTTVGASRNMSRSDFASAARLPRVVQSLKRLAWSPLTLGPGSLLSAGGEVRGEIWGLYLSKRVRIAVLGQRTSVPKSKK